MADPLAQPSLGQMSQPVPIKGPPKDANDFQQRVSDVLSFIQRPEVQAGLMQFGISALQPIQPGQTSGGAIANAIGEGFNASGRVKTQEAATAQQALENQQKEAETAIRREQVDVNREGNTIARENIISREVEGKATREAAKSQLAAELANRLKISATELDNSLLEKSLSLTLDNLDPTLYGTPEEFSAAQQKAIRDAGNLMIQMRALRKLGTDPSSLSDEALAPSMADNPEHTSNMLRLSGFDEKRIKSIKTIADKMRATRAAITSPPAAEVSAAAPAAVVDPVVEQIKAKSGEVQSTVSDVAAQAEKLKELEGVVKSIDPSTVTKEQWEALKFDQTFTAVAKRVWTEKVYNDLRKKFTETPETGTGLGEVNF